MKTKKAKQQSTKPVKQSKGNLLSELSLLIEQSRHQVVAQVNSTLTMLFWQVGNRINKEVLKNKRAEYAGEIVTTVSAQLSARFGKGYEEKNLRRMIKFAKEFPQPEIVATLSRQLSWSHFVEVLSLKSEESKHFYLEMAASQQLGIRDLRKQISLKAYERTAIANTQIINSDKFPANTFKDPYFLDFLGLKNTYLEKDLEAAILRELEEFILELGKGFAFIERQKRMIIDGEDFNLDLLFYHRPTKRLVAIELKMEKFHAKHKGQMELYLKWLNRYEKQEGENPPVGLILCAESSREQIELLEMHKDGIMVAEFWTELPPKKELQQKIHQLIKEARERMERKKLNA